MAERASEVIVGGVVIAAAAAFLIYAGQITGARAPGDGDNIFSASFRSVEGVSVGTDVRLAGVKIGTVTALSLNPETFRADAELTIAGSVELPDDTAAVISSEGLLGGNFVELLPGGSPFSLEPGGEIVDTQGAVSIVQLLLKFATGTTDE